MKTKILGITSVIVLIVAIILGATFMAPVADTQPAQFALHQIVTDKANVYAKAFQPSRTWFVEQVLTVKANRTWFVEQVSPGQDEDFAKCLKTAAAKS